MNNSQRKFLIDKITDNCKVRIDVLKNAKPKEPDIENYIKEAIYNGTLKVLSPDEILRNLNDESKKKYRKAWGGDFISGKDITLAIRSICEYPEPYNVAYAEWQKESAVINAEISQLETWKATLETRIMLASDKTLQRMINEVDDMGDISLFDEKLKEISGFEIKKLN